MNNPLISIIVPVYNVEKYLSQCLDSILFQTYTNWEAILVDDGSPDNSGNICDEYAQKDSRFKVIHKENGGVSSARNIGIEEAKGKWFLFCDSDDLLYSDTLDIFVSRIKDGIDSVCGGYVKIDEYNNILKKFDLQYDHILDKDEALVDVYNPCFGKLFNGYLWNRLLRSDVIKNHNIKFREDIYIKEDGLFLVQFLCNSIKQHRFISDLVYKYRSNSTGAMMGFSKSYNKKSLSNLYARCLCLKEIEKVTNNKVLLNLSRKKIINKYFNLLSLLKNNKDNMISNFFKINFVTFKYISPFVIIYNFIITKIKK